MTSNTTDPQQLIHDEIMKAHEHGIRDEWNDGYITGLSRALRIIVEHDGVNHTGCPRFDPKEEQ
ncbi:hypothetical protein [Bifidobacterium felsineum]|uniref:hypothetical protein n=1 Tax=Bifidobacterium felsineum TaxID=2045440 RepID=UPI001BDD2CE1|nr:hypothetical protein [Bifidobacterium felsineum]MBT1164616.1 hypothetical protein [Bifidobacterium felsineum]